MDCCKPNSKNELREMIEPTSEKSHRVVLRTADVPGMELNISHFVKHLSSEK